MVFSMVLDRPVWFLYLIFVFLGVPGVFGENKSISLTRDGDVKIINVAKGKNSIRDDAIDKGGSESIEGYQEVKDKLREIFAQAVEPQKEEDVFEDYLEPDLDPLEPVSGNRKSLQYNFTPDKGHEFKEGKSRKRNLLFQDTIIDMTTNQILRNQNSNLKFRSGKVTNGINQGNHHAGHEHTKQYLNEWVVHLTGGKELAASVAKDLGYQFLGQVGNFEDVYRLVKKDHPATQKRDAPTLTHQLNIHAEVKWAEQQFVKKRSKRGILPKVNLIDDIYNPYAPLIREKRTKLEQELERNRDMEGDILRVERRSAMASQALEMENMFNDELWVHQWYLFDTRSRSDLPKLDLQVIPVWMSNVTGRGVRLLVLDDGLEWRHTDIINNYDAEISYDFNNDDNDPTPRYDTHMSNSHGTRCAGEIVMVPNNKKCGVGVAFGASVGGVRMLDGPVSDAVEGASLGWALDKVDIMTCSWGPTDDGRRVEGPGRLAQMAIEKGIMEGRGGKGVVYLWAAGNGGSAGDDCNCDGYASSIYTLSISSASETGRFPWYGERCASTLAAAYSSGAYTDQKIATTDLNNTCTDKFSGTSAAAPLAAGILALALEVNPELTWRDMQHAVVWSSEWAPLGHNSGWQTNSRGLKFNPRFGFGLLSAYALVQTVQNWTLVPEKVMCRIQPTSRTSTTLTTGESVLLEFETSDCEGTDNEIRSLEHVQVMASIAYTRRGALSISITSPTGTKTQLLNERSGDDSKKGFNNWPFMSVHTWGEDPSGRWQLLITGNFTKTESGTIGEIELVLHGTRDIPEHLNQERSYRIPYEEHTNDVEGNAEITEGLTAESLRTKPWKTLVELLTHSTRSTFSEADIKMLLKENRLEETLHNIQSEDEKYVGRTIKESDWSNLLQELISRK